MRYPLVGEAWGKAERAAAVRVLKSGRFTIGSETIAFENLFARKFGRKHAIMTASGSSANLLATAAACYRSERPLRAGDEVIVPAVAWSTTYSPLQQHGLKLRFVDVDLHTLNLDVASLQAALTPKTRAVLAVSILGNPAPLPEIRRFCDERGLLFLEDNCETIGARVGGRYAGTFGDISTFSFFYSHQMHAIEGGMVTTDDGECADILRCLRSHGWARELRDGSPLAAAAKTSFPEEYCFLLPGYNARPTEMNAAIGRAQLGRLDANIRLRRRNAAHWRKLFAGDERVILQKENGESSWFAFTVILHPELRVERPTILSALRRANIDFRLITGGNFLRHTAIKYFHYDVGGSIVNADIVHDRGFFVGNYAADLRPKLNYFHKVLTRTL